MLLTRHNLTAFVVGLAALIASPVHAQTPTGAPVPVEVRNVDVEEHLGDTLPLDLQFVDHNGQAVALRDYFDGERPVLLTLNYYGCPMLCGLQLNALTDSLRELDWSPGENFRIVTVSIDPDEDASLASAKRANHLQALGRGDDVEWEFLTGTAQSIEQLAEAVGYRYEFIEETGEFAHPATLMFASPGGVVTRYLYGMVVEPRDLRLALLEAGEGRVGTPVDHFVLACYIYDADTGGYVQNAFFVMRAGASLGVIALASLLLVLWRKEFRKAAQTVA